MTNTDSINIIVSPPTESLKLMLDAKQGIAGAKGDNGKSAYEIAVENGFKGNLQQWLDSLHGNIDSLETTEDFLSQYLLARG